MESIFPDGCNKEKSEVLNMTIGYLYSKFFKRVVRGKSILNSNINKRAKVFTGSLVYNSSLDRYSYIGYDCDVINCEIGAFCSIADGVIIGGAQHPLNWVSTSPVFYKADGGTGLHLGSLDIPKNKRTIIGHDVWIGHRAILMQGITIGNGAVIGAGAVVTKDVPPYAIVAGVPAKIIRYRFDENTIAQLQSTQWWTLPDNILRVYSNYISKPMEFCNMLRDNGASTVYNGLVGG